MINLPKGWQITVAWVAAVVGACLAELGTRAYTALPSADNLAVVPIAGMGEPTVSVIIPARDEERNLAVLLPTLVNQGAAEILVVDDGSTDRTAEVAAAAGATVIPVTSLPVGWIGKGYACAVGAAASTGDWLLFLDSDTWLAPEAIRRATRLATSLGVDALSLFPRQEVASIWEKTLLPFGFQAFFAGVAADPGAPLLNGQFILIRRSVYIVTGGHGAESVRGAVAEDVELGRYLHRQGVATAVGRGDGVARVRMYRGLGDIRAGFGKNAALFLSMAPRRGVVVAVATLLATIPLALLVPAWRGGRREKALAATAWLAQAIVAARWNVKAVGLAPVPGFGLGLLRPFAAVIFQTIGLESFVQTFLRRQVSWKGRSYSTGPSGPNIRTRRRLPWRLATGLILALVRQQRRSFLADCQALLGQTPMVWENVETLPVSGPLCLVANHYQRPDLWIGWGGALIGCAVAERRRGQVPHYLVLGDFHVRVLSRSIPVPGARWAFQSVARAWDLVPTTGLEDPASRSAALRALLRFVDVGEPIGVFPEGPKGRAGQLRPALPGIGRFLAVLARRGVPVVPVGIREEAGRLVARFGDPIADWPARGAEVDADARLGELVMAHIAACCLPGVVAAPESGK